MAEFRAQVAISSWYDGDTPRGVLDMGYGHYWGAGVAVSPEGVVTVKPMRLRIAVIDAWELRAPGGAEAVAAAREILPPGVYPCITTKLEEFGRPMVDPILPDGRPFSAVMLQLGHAVSYKK